MQRNKPKPRRLPPGWPMEYEPVNELGVVLLFAEYARRHNIKVEKIQAGFPDCIATWSGTPCRIEFEYRASSFRAHKHSVRGCDKVVCWRNDWPSCPKSLEVFSLEAHLGMGFNVWVQPVGRGLNGTASFDFGAHLAKLKRDRSWTVPSGAHKGDLILYYRTKPIQAIADLFVLTSDPGKERAHWKPGDGIFAGIRRVATLADPITLADLRRHRNLATAGFVRGGVRSGYRVTANWHDLHRLIVERNPSVAAKLKRYGPDRIK